MSAAVVELTRDDGRRIGIPAHSALIILSLEQKPNPDFPKAKALVRYSLGLGPARAAFVRDGFRQLLNLFPVSHSGVGWSHVTDVNDAELVIPQGSIASYDELPEGKGFTVLLNCEGGAIEVQLKTTYDDLRPLLGATERGAEGTGGEVQAAAEEDAK